MNGPKKKSGEILDLIYSYNTFSWEEDTEQGKVPNLIFWKLIFVLLQIRQAYLALPGIFKHVLLIKNTSWCLENLLPHPSLGGECAMCIHLQHANMRSTVSEIYRQPILFSNFLSRRLDFKIQKYQKSKLICLNSKIWDQNYVHVLSIFREKNFSFNQKKLWKTWVQILCSIEFKIREYRFCLNLKNRRTAEKTGK